VASIQKKGHDVQANQVKADKAVMEALNTVVLWVAKLPLVAILPAALASPDPVARVSPTPEVEVIRQRQGPKQGIKHRRTQVDAEDLLQVQILGEIAAIETVELALGRGKRVRISRK
jgi:hypothetical protein